MTRPLVRYRDPELVARRRYEAVKLHEHRGLGYWAAFDCLFRGGRRRARAEEQALKTAREGEVSV